MQWHWQELAVFCMQAPTYRDRCGSEFSGRRTSLVIGKVLYGRAFGNCDGKI